MDRDVRKKASKGANKKGRTYVSTTENVIDLIGNGTEKFYDFYFKFQR